ncbi:MAG: LysM peptidoglycan-binding domain-containing protein [Patescibacteria group bacterium]
MKIKRKNKYLGVIIFAALFFSLNFGYIANLKLAHAANQTLSFTTAGDYTYDNTVIQVTGGKAQLSRSPEWWNTNYTYRKKITVTAGSTAVSTDNTITFNYDIDALVTASKMENDQSDLRIAYWDGDSWSEIHRDYLVNELATSPSDNAVRFKAQAVIPAAASDTGYYIYYGNNSPGAVLNDPTNVYQYYEGFDSDPGWSETGGACTAPRYEWNSGRLTYGTTEWADCYAWDASTAFSASLEWYFEATEKRTSAGGITSLAIKDTAINEGWWWFVGNTSPPDPVEMYTSLGWGNIDSSTPEFTVSQDTDYRHTMRYSINHACGTSAGYAHLTTYVDGIEANNVTDPSGPGDPINPARCPTNLYPHLSRFAATAEYDDYKVWQAVDETATAGSEELLYDSSDPVITNTTALNFDTITAFSETAAKNGGEIKYILSNDDGTTWNYYSGGWATSNGTYSQANTDDDINTNAATFPVGDGELKVRAFLHSDGSQQVQLSNLAITLNNYPSATFDNDFAAWQSGDIIVNYNLIDKDSDGLNISQAGSAGMEYSTNGSTWTDASMKAGGDGLTGLDSSASPGEDHQFIWNSASDLANTYDASVYLRIRPNDGSNNASAWLTSDAFGVDNKAPTSVSTPTFGTITTSSISINKPTVTENGSGLAIWQVRRNNITALSAIANSASTVTDSSLNANTLYTYDVRFTDNQDNVSSYSNDGSVYTLAKKPGTPAIASIGTSLLLVIDKNNNPEGSGNSDDTEYVIYETSSEQYVQADGTLGDDAVWQTYGEWGGDDGQTIIGLNSQQQYVFKVKARNGDNLETAFSGTIADNTGIEGPINIKLDGESATENGDIVELLITNQLPTFTGYAEPLATIYLDIYSSATQTYSTTLGADGFWSVKVTEPIALGKHEVYARVVKGDLATTEVKIADFRMISSSYLATPTIFSPIEKEWLIDSTPTISGLSRSGNTIRIYIDDELAGTTTATIHPSGTGSFTHTLTDELDYGRHTISIEADDGSGSLSSRLTPYTFSVGLPTIGPTLFSITPGSALLNGIGWGDTDVRVYANGREIGIFYIAGEGVQNFSYTLPIIYDGTYEITARAEDAKDKPSHLSNSVYYTQSSGTVASMVTMDYSGTYVVKKGDSLWSIAQSIYGDGGLYNLLIEANVDVYSTLTTNPSVIHVGWRLVIT